MANSVDDRVRSAIAKRQIECVYGVVPCLLQQRRQPTWELRVNQKLHTETKSYHNN
jgi:hypothetical protein